MAFSFVCFENGLNGYFLCLPIGQVKEFLDFSPLVTVFHRLLGLMIHLPERMFCISNGLGDGI